MREDNDGEGFVVALLIAAVLIIGFVIFAINWGDNEDPNIVVPVEDRRVEQSNDDVNLIVPSMTTTGSDTTSTGGKM